MIGSSRLARQSNPLGWFVRPRVAALLLVAIFALYFAALHPWYMNWGATSAEQRLALPGDELPANPDNYFTRAITIDAPVEQVWPWLLQIGQDRAGFYSNDWLENLFGGDIHNADEIRPEWQSRAIGDKVPMAPREYLGGGLGDATLLTVRAIEPDRMITDLPGRFVLQPIDARTTRLYLREPIPAPAGGLVERFVATTITRLVWDPMHFVMEQGLLRGIKARAEGHPHAPLPIELASQVGWALGGLGLVGLFLARRGGWAWLVVPVAAVAPSFYSTRDPSAALAGFLAVGISLLGLLVYGRRWLAPFALLAAVVLLGLLLAPNPYLAFGLAFNLVIVVFGALVYRARRI
jgi:hypothetical protein